MKEDCSTCLYKDGSCYPSSVPCRSYEPDPYDKIADLEKQIEQMKKCLKGIIYMAESGLHTKNELAFARLIAEAKVFLRSKI